MAVTYKNLFKLLIDKNMKKGTLCEKAQISPSTLSKMANDANVSMDVIDRICVALECSPNDIMEITPDVEKTE